MTASIRLTAGVLAALSAASLLAGCAAEPSPAAVTSASPSTTQPREVPLPAGSLFEAPVALPTPSVVQPPRGTLRPDGRTAAQRVPEIMEAGKIVVGVDPALNLLSFRDPHTGELRGFEVDLAHEIAADIFGDRQAVEFRFLDAEDLAQAVLDRRVDMVIRGMTITAALQEQVEFSAPYLRAQSRVLTVDAARGGAANGAANGAAGGAIEQASQVDGHPACVVDKSSALEVARSFAPHSPLLRTRTWSDCLVALQQGQVDAIVADDILLSGIAAQDATTRFAAGSLRTVDYGVAVNPHEEGLLRQVNATIARITTDGTWAAMFARWFSPWLRIPPAPEPTYRLEEDDG